MESIFLGVDVGSSKTHACLADATGQVIGFGGAGAGNHETVGYAGMERALADAVGESLTSAGLGRRDIDAAGFGISGFDWESERPAMIEVIDTLGLAVPLEIVNDAMLGVIAGTTEGWGLAIVSGTGCNCHGRTRDHKRYGMVTGAGQMMGEAAGAGDLVRWAIHSAAYAWTRRGPPTQLAEALVARAGARDLEELLEGIINGRYVLTASAAPLVFQTAASGDAVAQALVERAGRELAELAKAVIRQLDLLAEAFEIVLIGGMFNAGEPLIRPLRESVLALASGARFVRLEAPPVVGAVLLAMEQDGRAPTPEIRERLRGTVGNTLSK